MSANSLDEMLKSVEEQARQDGRILFGDVFALELVEAVRAALAPQLPVELPERPRPESISSAGAEMFEHGRATKHMDALEAEVARLREQLRISLKAYQTNVLTLNRNHQIDRDDWQRNMRENVATSKAATRAECLAAVRAVDETGAEGLIWHEDAVNCILALPETGR